MFVGLKKIVSKDIVSKSHVPVTTNQIFFLVSFEPRTSPADGILAQWTTHTVSNIEKTVEKGRFNGIMG